MNIISDFSKDTQTPKPLPGSYEWWYFDALSEDGYAIVVIFYEGNPFSRKYIEALQIDKEAKASDFPAISISMYRNGKPVYYSFEEVKSNQAAFSANQPKGNIGQNSFSGFSRDGATSYTVQINQLLPNGDSLNGELKFESKISAVPIFQKEENPAVQPKHSWNLIQPKAEVSGKLKVGGTQVIDINFEGKGYHDHNFGSEPMKDSFDEWYWGRYHFDDSTLIYYIMNMNGKWEEKAWIFNDDGRIESTEKVELKDKGLSFFGLSSARKFEFEGDSFKALLQKSQMIDSGPFYQRFRGEMILKRGGTIQKAQGISEYIYPSRIYKKIFWPLVDMRINYPGKHHWVQKSPVFYRWTW